MKYQQICIVGPSCSGKTSSAIAIAQRLQAEIISIDSALIYRGMDIGSAKPSQTDRKNIPHHLIDIRNPDETYSVAQCYTDVELLLAEFQHRQKPVILVGGTMMYFNVLTKGLVQQAPADPEIRARLHQDLAEQGLAALYARLQTLNPTRAQALHPNDQQRILRALELALQPTATSELSNSPPLLNHENTLFYALVPTSRELLRQLVIARLDQMLRDGLIDEVRKLIFEKKYSADCNAFKAVGYRQVVDYLLQRSGYDEMYERIIHATMQLTKRQMTWIRSMPYLHQVYDADELWQAIKHAALTTFF